MSQSDLPLTISAQYGLIDQRSFFNSQVASRDMSDYYLLEKGEFAYNKSTSNENPWGAVKRLTKYEKGCLSTLYICFAIGEADPDFLVAYYETNRWHRSVQMIAAEGARNHGLLNISPDDFFETELRLPASIVEQVEIGGYFRCIDSLVTLHQRKCRQHVTSKAFFWEQRKLGDFGSVQMCKRIYKEQTAETGEVPFFKIGTFGEYPDSFISNELFEKYRSQHPFPKLGTPLISAAGSIGRTVIYQGERAYYQDSNIVWLEHDGGLKDSFLAQLYEQMDWKLEGSTIKRLYNKDILNAEARIPSLSEQKGIGAFFFHLDSLITLHQ